MSWNTPRRRSRTLRFRLAFWSVCLLAAVSFAVFTVAFLALDSMQRGGMDAELAAEVHEWNRIRAAGGLDALRIEFESEFAGHGGQRVFCRFFGPDLSLRLSTDLKAWSALPPPPRDFVASGTPGGDGVRLESLRLPGRDHGVRTAYCKDAEGNVYQFGHSEEEIDAVMRRFRMIAILGALALTLAGGAGAYLLATRSLAGLRRVTDGVMHVTRGDFSRRIEVGHDAAEIEELARAFNHLQDRIQTLIRELGDVSMNIAHDLRSPLTRIRAAAEAALTGGGKTPAEYRETLGVVVEESDRLVGVINTMLSIAEAESRLVDYTTGVTDLTEVVRNAVELFRALADTKRLSLEASLPGSSIRIRGDESRLQRVIANLLDNAIKYTPPGGKVAVRLFAREDGRVAIEVLDTGVGIPGADLARVFDRFYRGEPSRSSAGNGLGLSYVASIVRAHGGEVAVTSTVGRRTLFTVSFPGALRLADPEAGSAQDPLAAAREPRG